MQKKTILITGAANGIGQVLTKRCLDEGYRVVGCDIDKKGLESLKAMSETDALSIFYVDVSNHEQVTFLFDDLKKHGLQPTCLVNNAGIYLGRNLLDYSLEEIQRVINVNCIGAIFFSQLFAKSIFFNQINGIIVNISSVAGEEGSSDAVYGLSKAALLGLTKSCAMNFAPFIRVNAIAPGLVTTDLIKQVPPARMEEYRLIELLKEPILPDDVADTLIFLISDKSRHYTGAIFDLNNGCYRR